MDSSDSLDYLFADKNKAPTWPEPTPRRKARAFGEQAKVKVLTEKEKTETDLRLAKSDFERALAARVNPRFDPDGSLLKFVQAWRVQARADYFSARDAMAQDDVQTPLPAGQLVPAPQQQRSAGALARLAAHQEADRLARGGKGAVK
jgi:hypothetical protein